jgi:hypothetical protein
MIRSFRSGGAEVVEERFFIKKYSELRDLCASEMTLARWFARCRSGLCGNKAFTVKLKEKVDSPISQILPSSVSHVGAGFKPAPTSPRSSASKLEMGVTHF